MAGGGQAYGDPRDSVLGQVTGAIYWYLVVTVLVALTCLPALVALMLLDRSAANAPLAALCLAPIGPALSAALFAVRDRLNADEPTPARSFWRGYRLNAGDVLRLWLPALIALAVIAVSLTNLEAAGVPDGYAAVLLAIGALVLLWAMNSLVIGSLFAFRTRDLARLGAYYLVRLPLVTLGTASLLILAAGIVYLTSDAMLFLVGGLWAALLLRNAQPLVRHVQARFIAR
jgi:formate hydrogenlyase subunit 3/multisubunit Na+/H+ antiporter MnhD subunit